MSCDQQQKIQVAKTRIVKLILLLQTDGIWISDWVFKKVPTWDYICMRRLKAKACVSGGPTSLKLTPTAEQDQETTKRREEVDGRNIGSSLDLWSDNSIATAIIKHAHFWNPSQIFVLANFYALFTFLPLLDCPFGASFVFVLLLVRLIFNTLFYTRDLCRQARLERVSSCAFQVKF